MENKDRPRRSWLIMLGLLVFAYALLSKWNKWPAGTFLLIVSGIITWAGALVYRYQRGHGVAGISWFATAMFVTYIVFRLLYWPGAVLMGASTLGLATWVVVLWRRQRRTGTGWPALAGIVLACTIALMAVPVHALYHYMFFETPGAQRFMHSGVGHWYRYSWFLYQDGQYAKSATMIDSAMAEVAQHKARTGKDGEWLLVQLRGTRSAIEARTWDVFRQLHSPYEQPRWRSPTAKASRPEDLQRMARRRVFEQEQKSFVCTRIRSRNQPIQHGPPAFHEGSRAVHHRTQPRHPRSGTFRAAH